ncbi:hypothetical protein O181_005034 [Austropuccinia psidii MF-1]|uniref:Uncharacterized protein n=1 Tax=Austropuccinia psidii MF-1 TaxID=1389203 RepID=A0A9Q3BHD1_9BASI|nr:hypothetical protein [Austropuccinia psidii MF-1]
MYIGMPPYSCPCSLLLSRSPTLRTKTLMPFQDPNALHAKPCAGEASQQFQQFLMLFRAPNSSHANPYTCKSSLQFKQLPMLQKPPKNPETSFCWYRLPMLHIKILTLCRFPTIETIPYAVGGFQQFRCKSLCL